ncbi:hypothetical protein JX265_012211 [Neoarthrinium moseri]|uniref:Uncharacterized protein n=1 Tax=Neoarthrinium moseri TaxID=1658444 RepID=A0A9Q0AJU1_9PEZI|nr:uncharacterized protein JN550_006946 [Neoarthrinium moseri]KAI1855766.1 hypothetical protein JX265_012211 [Neoarthrinium moseri]KAI1867805.1 hypothetical protein JN550_006946 [Neoarthrinium moseri]
MWKFKLTPPGNTEPDRDIIPPDVEDPPPQRSQTRTPFHNMASQPSSFPETLPPRPQKSKDDRLCPGARFCWPFDWSSWSLNTNGDHALLMRRICMWVTLAVRTFTYIMSLILNLYGFHFGAFVIGIVFTVLGFFFIAWCLVGIAEAKGSRRVLGTSVNRWHFDVFLLGSAVIHIGLIFILFFARSATGFLTTWYGMWILIFAAKWITAWTPEEQSNV